MASMSSVQEISRKRKISCNSGDEAEQQPSHSSCGQKWIKITRENLDCSMLQLYSKLEADLLLEECESSIDYYSSNLTKIKVFGKYHSIPRKQVAFGDEGLSYTFSGVTVAAKEWTPLTNKIRHDVETASGYKFNFVLVNRYQ